MWAEEDASDLIPYLFRKEADFIAFASKYNVVKTFNFKSNLPLVQLGNQCFARFVRTSETSNHFFFLSSEKIQIFRKELK